MPGDRILEEPKGKSLLIYVAGPYTADTIGGRLDNMMNAIYAGKWILERGHFPFIPHFTHFFDQVHWDCPPSYKEYCAWDMAILERCDALLFIDHSPGADKELARAEELGLIIFYDADSIPDLYV